MPTCPTCGTALTPDDKFCSGCGGAVAAPRFTPEIGAGVIERNKVHLPASSARKWLLIVSIITLVSGFIFYGIQREQVEKDIRNAESMIAHLSDQERDEGMMREVGMTWDQVKAHDRGMVNLLLAVNIGLAIIYFGLWIYAKKNPYVAALIALILFVTVMAVSAVYEPSTLAQGLLIKGLFIAALVKAVSSGHAERKLRAAM